jgi:hypothetical protein
MGLAEQGRGAGGEPSRSRGSKASDIARKYHANLDRAALVGIVPMLTCVIARSTQQYRCRAWRNEPFIQNPYAGWLISNALIFCDDASSFVGWPRQPRAVTRVQISLIIRIAPASDFRA